MPSNPFKNEPSATRLALNRLGLRIRNLERRFVNPGTTVGVITETFFYDTSSAAAVSSSQVLADGEKYLIVVQGDWSFWNEVLDTGAPESDAMFPGSTAGRVSTEVGVDAETVFGYPSDSPSAVLGHHTGFQIDLGSGFAHIEPDDGSDSSPVAGHLYSYTIIGEGSVASFRTQDPLGPFSDNYGKLKITIQALEGTGTGGGGGGGSGGLVPPTTSGDADDVLRVGTDLVPFWDPRIWRPVMTLDPTTGNYLPVTTGDGDAVMTLA